MKRQYKLFLVWFGSALKIAIAEHDDATLKEIETVARKHHRTLSDYIDQLEPTVDLDPEIIVLADYFKETAEDISKALQRKPKDDDDDPSEAWKKTG